MNSFANRTNSIAKVMNSIAKACNVNLIITSTVQMEAFAKTHLLVLKLSP